MVASSDGVQVAYERHGAGKITLVFVHGWSCDRSYWRNQVSFFAATYQVVLVDLAGHGDSGLERERYSMKAFAHDVKAVVDAVGAKEVVLVGHSMGGAVIAHAAQLMPDRVVALVGIDTLQDVTASLEADVLEKMVRPFEEDFVPSIRKVASSMFVPSSDEQLVERIRSDMAAAPPAVAISALREYLGEFAAGEVARIFHGIRAPLHCLNATAPPTATQSNRKHIDSFEVTIMKDVGHFMMLERPARFNKLLAEILAKLPAPRTTQAAGTVWLRRVGAVEQPSPSGATTRSARFGG
jgi:pimeloyl-ACP methyl ester carboxylesterase